MKMIKIMLGKLFWYLFLTLAIVAYCLCWPIKQVLLTHGLIKPEEKQPPIAPEPQKPVEPPPPKRNLCVFKNSDDISVTEFELRYDEEGPQLGFEVKEDVVLTARLLTTFFSENRALINSIGFLGNMYGLMSRRYEYIWSLGGYMFSTRDYDRAKGYRMEAVYGQLFKGVTWDEKVANLLTNLNTLHNWLKIYEVEHDKLVGEGEEYIPDVIIGQTYVAFNTGVECKVVAILNPDEMGFNGPGGAPIDVVVQWFNGSYGKIFSAVLIPTLGWDKYKQTNGSIT